MKKIKRIFKKTLSGPRLWMFVFLFNFLTVSVPHHLSGADIFLQIKSTGRKTNISIFAVEDSKVSSEILKTVSDDLSFSGIFNVIELPPAAKQEKNLDFLKADHDVAVVNGVEDFVKFNAAVNSGKLVLTGTCWDVNSIKEVFNKTYSYDESEARLLAHNFSQDIVKFLTGQKAGFSSRIAFSNNSSGSKEIWCVDYDGKNLTRLTYNNSISIIPKFSANGRYIYYTTYRDGNPDIFRYDCVNKKSAPFVTYQGLNMFGSASPDGKYFIATLSMDGDPELYLFTVEGRIVRRLTYSKGVDTAASFSPNSNEFVFVSERTGYPQLFIMDIDGTNIRRITQGGYNDSPCWSPTGGMIAYTKREGGIFNIYVLDVSTNKEYQLTRDSGSNENPSFSPDGRHIVFSSSRRGRHELFTMFADGSGQKPLASIAKSSTNPVWSQ